MNFFKVIKILSQSNAMSHCEKNTNSKKTFFMTVTHINISEKDWYRTLAF